VDVDELVLVDVVVVDDDDDVDVVEVRSLALWAYPNFLPTPPMFL